MLHQERQGIRLSKIWTLWALSLVMSVPAHGSDIREDVTRNATGKTTFFLTEKPGPHPVGIRVVEQYDYSRGFQPLTDDLGKPYRGETARPMQTLMLR